MPENLHSIIGIIVHPGIIFPKLLEVSDECYPGLFHLNYMLIIPLKVVTES